MDERRRRVMMSTGAAATATPTPSSRKRIEELREARRPSMAYGSQVRRCLRGRWFSLVPVSRAAFAKTLLAIAVMVFLLVALNDASVRYDSIAGRPTWLEVLRINRYGSLGRFVIGLLYLAVAGAAWLVYQLRRYRNDDFSGNYQLWQWIVGTAMVASFASTVPLTEMGGVGIEWILGKRVALSGEDWIELFLMVGGAILALRTIAEMWHYRLATALMLGGWGMIAIPIAAEWNVIAVENVNRWTIVTSAPLIAAALWFAATVGYLRCLFREVRGIQPTPGFIERFRLATHSEPGNPAETSDDLDLRALRPQLAKPETTSFAKPTPEPKPIAKPTGRHARVDKEGLDENRDQPKRSLWSLFQRRPKPASTDQTKSNDRAESPKIVAAKATQNPNEPDRNHSDKQEDQHNDDQTELPVAKKRRFGLGSIMKRSQPNRAEGDHAEKPIQARLAARNSSNDDEDDSDNDHPNSDDDDVAEDGEMSEDDIDWSSMSKAERRRMRKQLKRGGRAA